MEYFLDNINYIIVSRDHKINAEVVDGRLSEIDKNKKCHVIANIPNIQWSFDGKILETTDVINAYQKANKLGKYGISTKPEVFYTAVPVDYLSLYSEKHKISFTTKSENRGVITNINFAPSSDKVIDNIKLVRNSESPTYIYKSPNQK